MKKTIILLLMSIVTLGVTSCGSLVSPSHAEEPNVLRYVYKQAEREYNSDHENAEGFAMLGRLLAGKPLLEDPLSDDEISQKVSAVEHYLNADIDSDDYVGFWVVYEVSVKDSRYYVLLDLVEWWDDENRYEAKAIAVESSISAINYYLD